MNKLYTSALAVALIAQAAQAQNQAHPVKPGNGLRKAHTAQDNANFRPTDVTNGYSSDRAIFWSEDFSGGAIPAGWTNEDVLTPNGTPNVTFVWSNNINDVSAAALNYLPSSVFNSSTGANGYLWCNSDRGLTDAPGFDHGTELTTTAIDCSGQPSVLLTFESLIGVFDYDAATNVKVQVSTDLSTWTDFVPFPCLVTGAAAPPCTRWSANPQPVALNISSVAANQSTVYIRFQWIGGWEYFWALDDLTLGTVPDYDRVLDYSLLSHTGDGNEYGRVPVGQLGANFFLGGQVRNTGVNDQTNLVLNMSVEAPGGGIAFSAAENIGTLPAGDTATVEVAVPISGLEPGVYTSTTWVTSNEDASEVETSNDSIVRTFELTNGLYSLDGIGVHLGDPILSSIGTSSFVGGEDALVVLTYYRAEAEVTVTSIEILLDAANSVEGGTAIVSIVDSTDVLADVVDNPIETGADYIITAADITNGYLSLPLNAPTTLAPGAYYAAVEMYSNTNTNDWRILDDATVPQPPISSAIYIAGDQVYTNGNALAIRLVTDPVSIEENELAGISIYPNPSLGQFTVNAKEAGNHTAIVTNILGEVVATERFNTTLNMDLSGLAKGVYSVRVSTPEAATTQRITLQ